MKFKKMKKFLLLTCLLNISLGIFAQQNITRVEGSPYPASSVPDKLFLTSESFSYSQKIALQSLQGMLARTKPEILRDSHGHAKMLEDIITIDRTYYNNFNGLLGRYADRFNGYILCESRTASVNVAFSLCPILNAIAIPADIEQAAKNAGYTMVMDVRGKDENWALENYGNHFSKDIVSYQNPSDDRALFLGDYSIFAGALQFWDSNAAGSLATSVYERMNPSAVYFGWGAGEYNTVEQISRRSAMIHPSDWSPNLSTLSNIPVKLPRQKKQPTAYKVVPNVHTVCFVISDGDNIQWLSGSSDNTNNWANPNNARLNQAWTTSPAFAELAPVIYKKYIDNLPIDEFANNRLIAGPSGVGYYFPSIYPELAGQHNYLNKVMKKADLSIVNIIDVDGQHNPNDYLAQSNVDALFYYSYGAQYQGIKGEIKWYKDKPSIGGKYAFWGNSSDNSPETKLRVTQNMAKLLNSLPANTNAVSGYTLVPVHIWTMNPTDVLNCINMLNPNIRVVTPDEFVWLIRKNLRGLDLGSGNGLQAEYAFLSNPEHIVLSINEASIDFDSEYLTEATEAVGENDFIARWHGKIQPIYTEQYTFHTTALGGAKLKINGRTLCDSLENTNLLSADTITLQAGVQYEIELIYKKTGENGLCMLEWESNSQHRQLIPHYQLFSRPKSSTDIVTLYDDINFSGYSSGLKLGNFDSTALVNTGLQSIKITNGLKVILYSENNYEGDSLVLTANASDLGDWKNRATSLKVISNGVDLEDGLYTIKIAVSNYNIGIEGSYMGTEIGAKAQLVRSTGNITQQFKFTKQTDNSYTITALSGGGNWEIANFSKENDALIQHWRASDAYNQRFLVLNTELEGVYKILSCFSRKIIEAAANSTAAAIRQKDDNNQISARWNIIPVEPLINGAGNGLTGDYYNGMNFNSLVHTRVDSIINFNWGTGSPARGVNVNNFSVRWQGQIEPRFTENYTFFINSDNGRRLWIDDKMIIDEWLDDYDIEYAGSVSLTAGTKHDIKLEYFEKDGGAYCHLEWISPRQPREFIPASQLYPLGYSGIHPLTYSRQLRLFPNPAKGNTVRFELVNEHSFQENLVQIRDMTGKLINTKHHNQLDKTIDISAISNGIYFVSVTNNNNTNVGKLLIER